MNLFEPLQFSLRKTVNGDPQLYVMIDYLFLGRLPTRHNIPVIACDRLLFTFKSSDVRKQCL